MIWVLLKTLLLVVLAILIRGTLPRYRIDQLTSQHWKTYIFIYISFFINIIILYYLFF